MRAASLPNGDIVLRALYLGTMLRNYPMAGVVIMRSGIHAYLMLTAPPRGEDALKLQVRPTDGSTHTKVSSTSMTSTLTDGLFAYVMSG